ncbi:MAG TPA: helix-turn-helix transcriptional regulator [Nocardioides sp.]
MTTEPTTPIGPSIGTVIRDQIRDLRERAGMSRPELAETARQYGAPDDFSQHVVRFLEVGRRGPTVVELIALAQALEVSPLELLGDQADAFIGTAPAPQIQCPTCAGEAGRLEQVTRDDLKTLGDLHALEPTLVETAYRLAAEIDRARGEAARELPKLTKELRATLDQIAAGRRAKEPPDGADDDDDLDDLDEPE